MISIPELEKKIYQALESKKIYPDELLVQNSDLDPENIKIQLDIMNGDWSHEHNRSKLLLGQLFTDLRLLILSYDQIVLKGDGSDTYSATHTYLVKPLD